MDKYTYPITWSAEDGLVLRPDSRVYPVLVIATPFSAGSKQL